MPPPLNTKRHSVAGKALLTIGSAEGNAPREGAVWLVISLLSRKRVQARVGRWETRTLNKVQDENTLGGQEKEEVPFTGQ